ncbi:MAG: hypothetical protein K0R66_843 [Gammaproteobacteria bacterium]|nr:hypothetical protein [Gammaproteobacteria bacterium]
MQRHPEAYSSSKNPDAQAHQALIRNLAKEADIFHRRFQMLCELKMRKGNAMCSINPSAAEAVNQKLGKIYDLHDEAEHQ